MLGNDAVADDESGLKKMTPEELLEKIHKAKKEKSDALDLSNSGMTSLPGEIGNLKKLSRLCLAFNQLSELPKEISRLKNLTVLDLGNNRLTELPGEIGQLKNLRSLSLNYNQLATLPKEMTQIRNLTHLNLHYNQLSELPKKIGYLKHLTAIYLSYNQLDQLPGEIGQLKNLERLYLNYNQLTAIPREIGQLRNLDRLYLNYNQLTHLPEEIGNLKKLVRLDLRANQLAELPEAVGQLSSLIQLDLRANQLAKLPDEITRIENLTLLDLSLNQLKRLPKEIIRLEKLQHLDLNENPMIFPPLEIASQGASATMDYLRKSDKGGQLLYEGKILIVGQGGVGKTSLIKRLMQDEYSESEITTEGIDIYRWKLDAPDTANTEMTLNVWDFGGQEIYHATHQFFLTRRSLYMLVWDARQEDEFGRLIYWLNTIETFAEDSPIMIVMNKCEERTKDLNLKDLKQRFPQIIASGKVSAKKGIGIQALRNFIAKHARKLPLMGTPWPLSWLAVRRALETTSKHHIPYNIYLQLCQKAGIEESEAKTLSRYLHDLGIILHFQKDILLKDTIILKPEWGTDAVYKVLDARTVQERSGILYNTDLPDIWSDKELYPPDKYATILRLMENFELIFPFGAGDRYIVTELLSPKEIQYEWDPGDCLQFEYHYDFLPAGIISRLIVRMHDFLIEEDGKVLCWLDGAYLQYEKSRAVVKINAYTKIAVIQIDGTAKREFLAIIRSQFAAIHRTIKKIRFKEKIPCICNPNCEHRFDYNILLKYEEKNKSTATCDQSIEEVSVGKLLDGIEMAETRQRRIGGSGELHQIRDGERLAAIMFTDIVGFSKRMEKNEEQTLNLLLGNHFQTIRSILEKHRGTEIKTIGDSFMVMFRSAADAVKCAMEIQDSHQDKDGLVPRIGIHIGDLIFKNGDIFGDSVNIAARIEPLADPGGICISEDVYNIVKKKMNLNAVKLENVIMKNINDPPAVYKVLLH